VDATIAHDRVYVAFRNGSMLALNTTNSSNLTKLGLFVSEQSNVDAGQFFPIRNGLDTLYITDQKLYLLKNDSMVALEGYRTSTNF
jgi:hypothetical protein